MKGGVEGSICFVSMIFTSILSFCWLPIRFFWVLRFETSLSSESIYGVVHRSLDLIIIIFFLINKNLYCIIIVITAKLIKVRAKIFPWEHEWLVRE